MNTTEPRVPACRAAALAALFTAALAAGCANMQMPSMGKSDPAAATPASPAPAKSRAGMNERGEVVDSSKVEAGSGQTVKVGTWEGEITGKPGPASKFNPLKIGMSMRQVTDIAGSPTDQGAYMTGKAWIPFYFGADRHRFEMVYKNMGRLIFAGGSLGDFTGGNLIWIIHNGTEGGYR